MTKYIGEKFNYFHNKEYIVFMSKYLQIDKKENENKNTPGTF